MSLLSELKKHLNSSSKKQLENEFEELKEANEIGPSALSFLEKQLKNKHMEHITAKMLVEKGWYINNYIGPQNFNVDRQKVVGRFIINVNFRIYDNSVKIKVSESWISTLETRYLKLSDFNSTEELFYSISKVSDLEIEKLLKLWKARQ